MTVKYLLLPPESALPNLPSFAPFRAIVVIEEQVTPAWQANVSTWLVNGGCLYMMAWGKDCSSWDDSVDFANLEEFDFGDIPQDKDVMTCWHENMPLREVFQFAKKWAFHPAVALPNTVILHISNNARERELMAAYEAS